MRFDLTSKKIPLTALRASGIWQHLRWGDLGNSLLSPVHGRRDLIPLHKVGNKPHPVKIGPRAFLSGGR
jgi:hypothetical protein